VLDVPDEALAALALAADPDPHIDADAVPFDSNEGGGALLPEWYMPMPRRVDRRPSRVFAVAGIIIALLIVNGAGLCVTYGLPEIAW
jgi:hypothetical protein